MLKHFRLIPEHYGRTDGWTDGQTELLYQYRVSVCSRTTKIRQKWYKITATTNCIKV